MKIYTGTGDEGETSLFGGGRVSKDDARVAAYGEVDELNSFLGWAESQLRGLDLTDEIREIQNDLFAIGADLATPDGASPGAEARTVRLGEDRPSRLEEWIDRFEKENEPLTAFILPGGDPGAAALQVCRTVCRRAERAVVSLARHTEINATVLVYLNRLSDLLFVLARWENARRGIDESRWSTESTET